MSDHARMVEKPAGYAYPPDLARFVLERWATSAPAVPPGSQPEYVTLKHFFSTCYQASLLREAERPVTFRAILAAPELFPPDGMPPEQLQRLAFTDGFALEASELRRLSVAASLTIRSDKLFKDTSWPLNGSSFCVT